MQTYFEAWQELEQFLKIADSKARDSSPSDWMYTAIEMRCIERMRDKMALIKNKLDWESLKQAGY